MADASRYPDSTVPVTQGGALSRLNAKRRAFAGTLSDDERAAVLEAFAQAGDWKPSVGMRVLAMAFARSAEVRDAVSRWLRGHGPEVL